MKRMFATGLALTSVLGLLASPAVAAPPKHRAAVAHDTMAPVGQSVIGPTYARQSDIVTLNGRVLGADPDVNIRTQLLHDPAPNEY